MAQNRIRQSRLPEILAQFGKLGPGPAIQSGLEGFKEGASLASTLAAKRAEQEKNDLLIKGLQDKIAAQKKIQQLTEKGPITQPQPTPTLSVPEGQSTQQVPPPSFAPSGLEPGAEGPLPSFDVASPSPELQPAAEAEQQRQNELLGAAGIISPDKMSEQIIEQSGGAKLSTPKQLLEMENLQLSVDQKRREASTTGPIVDAAKKDLIRLGADKNALAGATARELKDSVTILQKGELTGARGTQAENQVAARKTNAKRPLIPYFAPSTSGLGQARIALRGAEKTAALIQQTRGKPINIQRREIATGVAQTIQRGTVLPVDQINALDPKTFITNMQELHQWITGKATPLQLKSFMEIFSDTLLIESSIAEMNAKTAQIQGISALNGFTEQERVDLAKSLGVPLKALNRGAMLREDMLEPDFKPVFAQFDPSKLTAEEILSGHTLLPPPLAKIRKIEDEKRRQEELGTTGLTTEQEGRLAELEALEAEDNSLLGIGASSLDPEERF